MANRTRFQTKVLEVAEWRNELKALEANRRLTAPAFLAAAMHNAGIDGKRIDELRATVEARRGVLPNLAGFIESMAQELGRSSNYVGPPMKVAKILAVWGTPTIEVELNEAHIGVLEAVAVAVGIAVERYGDKWGGAIDDVGAYERKISDLRARIARGYERLREMYEPKDVEIVPPDPLRSPELAKQGFAQIRFRDFKGVSPSTPSWPEQITETDVATPKVISGPPPKEPRTPFAIERTMEALGI